MSLDPNVKQYIAKEIQTAITRKNFVAPTTVNMDFAQQMAARVVSTKEAIAVDTGNALSEEQTDIFKDILYTLHSIAATDKNTVKERQQIRQMLARFIANSEVETDKLKEDIRQKQQEVDRLSKIGELDEKEKKKRMELFDELKKLTEKLDKNEEAKAKVAALDPGTGQKNLSAKDRIKLDLLSDLRTLFPGVRWGQQKDETFGGMIKRTAGDILRPFKKKPPQQLPEQTDLFAEEQPETPFFQRVKDGATSVADALFGRAAPKDEAMERLVAKEKAKLHIQMQAENIGAETTPAASPQMDLFTDQQVEKEEPLSSGKVQQLSLDLDRPPTMEGLRKTVRSGVVARPTIMTEEEALAQATPDPKTLDLFAPQAAAPSTPTLAPAPEATLEDIARLFAVTPPTQATSASSELTMEDLERLFAVPEETPAKDAPAVASITAAKKSRKKSKTRPSTDGIELPEQVVGAVTDNLKGIFDLLQQTIKKTADEATKRAEAAAKKEQEEKEKDEEGNDGPQASSASLGPSPRKGPSQGTGASSKPSRPSRGAARGAASRTTQRGATRVAARTATKGAAHALTKTAAKSVAKKIPMLGALAGLAFGAERLMSGDLLGAGGEVASGLLGSIPVVGTAASLAVDAGLAARDMSAAGGIGAQDSGVPDLLEQLAENDRATPPDATPAIPVLANPMEVSPSRSQVIQSPNVPSGMIRSPENSFVRFQDKRVARV